MDDEARSDDVVARTADGPYDTMSHVQPGESDLDARLRAALAASRELGAEYDAAMADSIRKLVVETQLDLAAQQGPTRPVRPATTVVATPRRSPRVGRRVLTGVSLVLAVPLSAVAGAFGHLPGIIVCWVGIVAVNVADRLPFGRSDLER
jgi:hypothetical protein